jgi:GT2 family glycosyltransferase
MLFDVERIKRIGLFDENIFLFSEEDELCDRTLNAGYGIRFCPDVYFEHLVGQACAPSPQIEYMKWWHFGWSNCYRLTKSKRSTPWRNPRRKMISYRIHSLISTKPEKRFKWKAKADGSKAFLMGEMAFDKDGRAQHSNF